jgi:predicted RNA-binding Zn-ribbon protein involved in translation (DUF1610 family)
MATQATNTQCPNCGGYKVKNFGDGKRENKKDFAVLCVLGAFFTWGIALLALPIALFIKDSKARDDGSIEYSCELCGYKWFHIPGTLLPTVTVRPELIREGAEKIAQDEQRAREAAWYANQQKKNK